MCLVKLIVLHMPVFHLSNKSYFFKGGPIHKPLWLPWAPLPHFSKYVVIYLM